jgi:hypothetical protein
VSTTYTPLSAVIPQSLWPHGLFDSDNSTFLDNLACLLYDERGSEDSFNIALQVKVMDEVRLRLPFLNGVSLVLGKGDGPDTGLVDVGIFAEFLPDSPPSIELVASTTVLSISFDNALLKPVEMVQENGKLTAKPVDGNVAIPLPFALRLSYINEDWSFEFDVPAGQKTGLNIPTCMIGDTGVVIEASDIELNFSGGGTRPAGSPADWKGFYLGEAKLYLPDLFSGSIDITDFGIGTGGIYGKLSVTFPLTVNENSTPHFVGTLATTLFGMEGGIRSISLGFTQNALTEAAIKGVILLPFFAKPVNVEIGIDASGKFTIDLGRDGGLLTLTKTGILEIKLDSLGFELQKGTFLAKLSGKVTPLFGKDQGLKWPTFDVRELSIDSNGDVHFEGGWLNLPNQYTLDFHGFHLEITQLGFGKTDDGGKFVGFSGGLKLVDGFQAGASVEGLRITWYDDTRETRITLNGVGVEFEIPETIRFKGHVSYRELPDGTHRFDGDIKLNLIALEMEIDGTLVFGNKAGHTFFAIYLSADLPAGIPLFSTGLFLYGLAGLFALNMEPNKGPEEGWYQNPDGKDGWYKRSPIGVTDLTNKWAPVLGSLAFGAGGVIGTSDNGFTFAGSLLLAMIFPGPIIVIQGLANLLKERAKLKDDPMFRALVVLDFRSDSFLIGLDARYRYGSGGELLDISASAEAFFSFKDGSLWHIYLGRKDPRERRIRASIIQLFEANCYFMLDAKSLAVGAWVGYDNSWNFGPASLTIQAWIQSDAAISWKPAYLSADLWLHGAVDLKVFGFGVGLTVDALFEAEVFDPFHVLAKFSVGLKLPWPLHDFNVDVTLEWGPAGPKPRIPLPLKSASIEHFKLSVGWSLLPSKDLLLPLYDDGAGFIGAQGALSQPADLNSLPVVPLDCRPRLTFAPNMHDDALVGINPQVVSPVWQQIGDPGQQRGPTQVRYSLQSVTLSKWNGTGWDLTASAPPVTGARTLYGSWAPVPQLPSGGATPGSAPGAANQKLWLWSKTPFENTVHTGSAWDDWFTTHILDYPCVRPRPERRVCCDFEQIPAGVPFSSPWRCPDHPELSLTWSTPVVQTISIVDPPVQNLTHALCFSNVSQGDRPVDPETVPTIHLGQPASDVTILVDEKPTEAFQCVSLADLSIPAGARDITSKGIRFATGDPQSSLRMLRATITGIFNTGVDASGAVLANGAVDPNYVLTVNPNGPGAGAVVVNDNSYPFPPWLATSKTSKWIGPIADQSTGNVAAGDYTYRLTFVVSGDPAGMVLNGKWTSDNIGNILLNGSRAGVTGSPDSVFTQFLAFSISNLVRGTNTLDFVVNNDGGPSGLRVEFSPLPAPGLSCDGTLEIQFPCPATALMLTVWTSAKALVTQYHADGSIAAGAGNEINSGMHQPSIIGQNGTAITRVVIDGTETVLQQVCFQCSTRGRVAAVGVTTSGAATTPVSAVNGQVQVTGGAENLTSVRLFGSVCVLQICATFGPSQQEKDQVLAMAQHVTDAMVHWTEEGEVLEPHAAWRLAVETRAEVNDRTPSLLAQTHYAYFRTEGPPGLTTLSVPEGHPNPDEFRKNTGLDDLTRYVRQTIPATVPAPGGKIPLPRPVFRAYDVGVEFNEDYVDTMYRLDGRDLALYLYDTNNRPVRGVDGRLIALSSQWGRTETAVLTEGETRWLGVVQGRNCDPAPTLDPTKIPHDQKLASAVDGQVLDPDTVHEGRLVPLLLHEQFLGSLPGSFVQGPADVHNGWMTVDEIAPGGPSNWQIGQEGSPAANFIVQTSPIGGGSTNPLDPLRPGAILVRANTSVLGPADANQPGNWTDYRLSVALRSSGAAIGLVFRYANNQYYRFSMDRGEKYRRLVRVLNGIHFILAEDDFRFRKDQDYVVSIEAIGTSLRIYQDGVLIFDVSDAAIDQGSVGLYCHANVAARFSDIRVDDFRKTAPVVYGFKFTTSQATDFYHQMHRYQDETWTAALPSIAALPSLVSQSTVSDAPLPEPESRAYDALITAIFGPVARQSPLGVQATRIENDGNALAFLVESDEPIVGARTSLEVLRAARSTFVQSAPGTAKLTEATFAGGHRPNDESVTLLVRDSLNLSGQRIEYSRLPGFLAGQSGDPLLLDEEFDAPFGGLLWEERIGPNSLDRYTIVDEGPQSGPSAWAVASSIVQTSAIGGDDLSNALAKPGTMAITRSPAWTDVRIRTSFFNAGGGDVGIVFRYQDARHYYRFSISGLSARLVKRLDDMFVELWSGALPHAAFRTYAIEAVGDHLGAYVDDQLLFSVHDSGIAAGRAGFYCWSATGANFETLVVEEVRPPFVLWDPAFTAGDTLNVGVAAGLADAGSQWAAAGGVLTHSPDAAAVLAKDLRASWVTGGNEAWDNIRISLQLNADDAGRSGVMFRYTDPDNYYLFSQDPAPATAGASRLRRLVKRVAGVEQELWSGAPFAAGAADYSYTLIADGKTLQAYLTGFGLFTVTDGDLPVGSVGLYCSINTLAQFQRVLVTSLNRTAGNWAIHDDGGVAGPSVWRISGGQLLQTSSIHGASIAPSSGTFAVGGDPGWTDYRLIVTLSSDDLAVIGIIFRYTGDGDYYRLSANGQRLVLENKNGGVFTQLQDQPATYTAERQFTLTVDCIGPRFVVYNGVDRVFEATNADHPAGKVGVYCSSNTGARFDRVEVRRPPLEAYALLRDRFFANDMSAWTSLQEGTGAPAANWTTVDGALHHAPDPAAPADASYSVAGDSAWTGVLAGVRLNWQGTGPAGLLFHYRDGQNYYRFAVIPFSSVLRLERVAAGAATVLWTGSVGLTAGRMYEFAVSAIGGTIRTYLDGVIACKLEDGVPASGRIALYASKTADARFSQVRVYPAALAFGDWLFDEPFQALTPGRWTFIDDGDPLGLSQWEVSGGELRQIYTGPAAPPWPRIPARYAVAGDTAWSDYRMSVRLRLNSFGTIGVVFRYQDGDNFYLLFFEPQLLQVRLERMAEGVQKSLWSAQVGFGTSTDHFISVDCLGTRISAYLDGVELVTLEDSALPTGRVGVYAGAKSDAAFSEVRVAAPNWETWYAFTGEQRLPAGKRMRVYAGNAADAVPEQPGVGNRFAATVDERGDIRLSAGGADLRLAGPAATLGHSRRFLPDAAYVTVASKVLRKADGASFFLFLPDTSPASSSLPAGEYRLKMTYRRDNRSADKDSQVLSEAGDSSPERVAIDVPWFINLPAPVTRLRIPQVVDGGAWKTTIILVNADSVPASFIVTFHQSDGTPVAFPLEGAGLVTQYSDTIPVGGSRTINSLGQAADLVQGWAEIVSARSISGAAVIQQGSAGSADAEGAVRLRSKSTKHFLLPFDNTQGFITAMAILNPDATQAASVSVVFRDENGQPISNESLTLGPQTRQAFALSTQFPKSAAKRGVVEFTSAGAELAALDLRFSPRGSFSSIEPIAIDSPPVPGSNAGIAQIVDGGGWQTTVMLINTGSSPAPFSLKFMQPDGSPLKLAVVGTNGTSEYSDVIPVGGSRSVETSGLSVDLSQGWGQVATPGSIAGIAILRQRLNASRDSECAVPLSFTKIRLFVLPFDNTKGFVMAMALANQDPLQSTVVNVTLRNPNGQILGNTTLNLGPLARNAFALATQFPETKDVQGVAEFSAANVDLAVVGLRFNPNGSFICVPPITR